jgi:hypothetical protein
MTKPTILVEFGHNHLHSIVDHPSVPDLTHVSERIEALEADYNVKTMTLIDDTSYNGTYDEYPENAVSSYINALDIAPDYPIYESSFAPSFHGIVNILPRIEKPAEDMDPAVFYSQTDEGLYLYWAQGSEFERIRLTDYRQSRKKTGFTPEFRCAAMTLGKMGLVDSPTVLPDADAVLTYHRDDFYMSDQYLRATELLRILNEENMVTFDDDVIEKTAIGDTQ